jgi:hypothetical protein
MLTLPYCTVGDVARKLGVDLQHRNQSFTDRITAKVQAVSDRWDQTTGTPMRQIRVGSPGAPATYEQHDARGLDRTPPVRVSLAYSSIVPLDASEGDIIEVRVGRDEWEDITAEEGDEWILDEGRGELTLYRYLIRRTYFERPSERFVRLSYRTGGLGGSRNRGGQTALDGDIAAGDMTLDVQNASRLPDAGVFLTIGTTNSREYVRVTAVNYQANTVTVTRGERSTSDQSHSDGDPVLYVPASVREAVAAKAAVELVKDEDTELSVPDDGQVTSRKVKADQWEADWEAAAAKHSSVRVM